MDRSSTMNASLEHKVRVSPVGQLANGSEQKAPMSLLESLPDAHQGNPSSSDPRTSDRATTNHATHVDAATLPMQIYTLKAPACVSCRRRKVRCDKQIPCLNCKRALIPCVYATGRATRRSRSRSLHNFSGYISQNELKLTKKLRKLEGIVEKLSGHINVDMSPKNSTSPSSTDGTRDSRINKGSETVEMPVLIAKRPESSSSVSTRHDGSPSEGILSNQITGAGRDQRLQKMFGSLDLSDGGGSRKYPSSNFLAKLNDAINLIRQDTQSLAEQDSDASDEETSDVSSFSRLYSMDNHNLIFSHRPKHVHLTTYHPLPSQISYLWFIYQENLEPLIKVLHIPSANPILRDARRNRENLTAGQEALVFAIYYAAIISLDAEEVQTNFNATKEDLLAQYRFAFEQALSKGNFLQFTDITILQAYTIFLSVLRRQEEARTCWSLVGLLIHLARGMGLHRDGACLKLSPFETEIRRRIWWQLLILDLRSSEDLGIDLIIHDSGYDTLMPSNINDADISLEKSDFPEPRIGKSDCAAVLIRYEICALNRRIHQTSASLESSSSEEIGLKLTDFADRAHLLTEACQGLETKFFKHILGDQTDPLYLVASIIARLIIAKICLVIYQPTLFPDIDGRLNNGSRHRIYIATIEVMEYSDVLNDPQYNQYRWLLMTYTNWHAIAYYLIETNQRAWTPLVERGWQALKRYGKLSRFLKNHNHGPLILPLRRLLVRAERHRTEEIARLRENPEEALRLDSIERSNPMNSWFGSLPNPDDKMEHIREAWFRMLQPAYSTAWTPERGQSFIPSTSTSGLFIQGLQTQIRSPNAWKRQFTSTRKIPPEVLMPDLDAAISRNPSVQGTNTQPGGVTLEMNRQPPSPHNQHVSTITATVCSHLRDPKLPSSSQTLPGNNAPQLEDIRSAIPMDATLDIDFDDTNMLGEDFDWQDWSQSIQTLEMDYLQRLSFYL